MQGYHFPSIIRTLCRIICNSIEQVNIIVVIFIPVVISVDFSLLKIS